MYSSRPIEDDNDIVRPERFASMHHIVTGFFDHQSQAIGQHRALVFRKGNLFSTDSESRGLF